MHDDTNDETEDELAKMSMNISNKDLGLKTGGNKTRTTKSGADMKTGDMKVNGKETGDNKAGSDQKTNRPNTAAATAPLLSLLPEGWEEAKHPRCGKTFYVNHNQGITTWDRPPVAATAAPLAGKAA